jgi:hypothetical protein
MPLWIVFCANILLALGMLMFVRESRSFWREERESRAKIEARLETAEKVVEESRRELLRHDQVQGNLWRTVRAMQEQIGWSDDHAWTRAMESPLLRGEQRDGAPSTSRRPHGHKP